MSHRALIVEYRCKPDHVGQFVDRACRHAALVREEAGCVRCDVLIPEEGGTTVYLYELFEDHEALEAHKTMPYMSKFIEDLADLIQGRVRIQCVVVNS